MLPFLHGLVLASTVKTVAVGEWDVFKGTRASHGADTLYSFEFHQSRTNPANVVSTLWSSSGSRSENILAVPGFIAQLEISFTRDNAGRFTLNGQAREFAFTEEEDGSLSASFSIDGAAFDVKVVSDRVIEVSYGDEDFVAMLQAPVKAPARAIPVPGQQVGNSDIAAEAVRMWHHLKAVIGVPKEYDALFDAVVGVVLIQTVMYLAWVVLRSLCCGEKKRRRPKRAKKAKKVEKPREEEEEREEEKVEEEKEKQD